MSDALTRAPLAGMGAGPPGAAPAPPPHGDGGASPSRSSIRGGWGGGRGRGVAPAAAMAPGAELGRERRRRSAPPLATLCGDPPPPPATTMAAPPGELLTLTPAAELRIRFELRKNCAVTLSLHNPTAGRVAFKIKTTSPKKYCVRPSSGVVEAGQTKDVQVRVGGGRRCGAAPSSRAPLDNARRPAGGLLAPPAPAPAPRRARGRHPRARRHRARPLLRPPAAIGGT